MSAVPSVNAPAPTALPGLFGPNVNVEGSATGQNVVSAVQPAAAVPLMFSSVLAQMETSGVALPGTPVPEATPQNPIAAQLPWTPATPDAIAAAVATIQQPVEGESVPAVPVNVDGDPESNGDPTLKLVVATPEDAAVVPTLPKPLTEFEVAAATNQPTVTVESPPTTDTPVVEGSQVVPVANVDTPTDKTNELPSETQAPVVIPITTNVKEVADQTELTSAEDGIDLRREFALPAPPRKPTNVTSKFQTPTPPTTPAGEATVSIQPLPSPSGVPVTEGEVPAATAPQTQPVPVANSGQPVIPEQVVATVHPEAEVTTNQSVSTDPAKTFVANPVNTSQPVPVGNRTTNTPIVQPDVETPTQTVEQQTTIERPVADARVDATRPDVVESNSVQAAAATVNRPTVKSGSTQQTTDAGEAAASDDAPATTPTSSPMTRPIVERTDRPVLPPQPIEATVQSSPQPATQQPLVNVDETPDSLAEPGDVTERTQSQLLQSLDGDLETLSQLLPKRAPVVRPAVVETLTPQAQVDLPNQIASRALAQAEILETGDSTRFRMKLDPPELGSVLIDMQKTVQGTVVRVTAAEPATQQLLQESVQNLNQGGSSANGGLDFDFSDSNQQQNSQDREATVRIDPWGEDEQSSNSTDQTDSSQDDSIIDFVA